MHVSMVWISASLNILYTAVHLGFQREDLLHTFPSHKRSTSLLFFPPIVFACSPELFKVQTWWTVSSSGHLTPQVPLSLQGPGGCNTASWLPSAEKKHIAARIHTQKGTIKELKADDNLFHFISPINYSINTSITETVKAESWTSQEWQSAQDSAHRTRTTDCTCWRLSLRFIMRSERLREWATERNETVHYLK